MTRCDVTELLADQCAHCLGLPELPTDPEPRNERTGTGVGPTIIARYNGDCAGCGRPIRTGQPITLVDDLWVGDCCAGVPS